jgi:hypothetical protein
MQAKPKPKRNYTFRVLYPDGTETHGTVEMSDPPTYDELRKVVEPHLAADLEHVYVWNDRSPGDRADMFVDEMGVLKNLPRNEEATRLYREASVRTGEDAESLPHIAGVAVLFAEKVWH